MQIAFGRVRRKTSPARKYGEVRNADRIWARTPQNLASEEVCAGLLFIKMSTYFRALL